MNSFRQGEIVYHKATSKKCVILWENENGTLKVRDEDNKEQDYYPQELELSNDVGGIIVANTSLLDDINNIY
jgi:hypothetical protein